LAGPVPGVLPTTRLRRAESNGLTDVLYQLDC
jgi:hypothetical protein